MGATKWTMDQQSAIDTRNCNLLVAAAAGSGKTAVLVERIIKIISDEDNPVDIDELLVVTFTNAAATEMRERIGGALVPESKNLRKQLSLLNKASITTLHSFCLQIIKNNFYTIDLDPDFRIADSTEAILLKQEVIGELFEEKYSKNEDVFLKLVECYGGKKDDKALEEIVLSLYEFVMSGPWPEQWLEEAAESFKVSEDFVFEETVWGELFISNLNFELEGLINMLREALKIAENSDGLEPYAETIREDIMDLEELKSATKGNWDGLYNSYNGFKFKTIKRCGKNPDKIHQEKVKAIRDKVKASFNKGIFILKTEDIIYSQRELYPLMKCLCQLVVEFKEKYSLKKKKKGLLDFSDLEHYCLEILTVNQLGEIKPSQVALDLRKKYAEVLVDEYQDSNEIQEVILGLVSRRDEDSPNLFMVGDVKQSIYRFRQAEPRLFLEKYDKYSIKEGSMNRKITLFKNFRSRSEILDGVNFIFKNIMSKELGELDYDDSEALNLGANFKEIDNTDVVCPGEIELDIIDKQTGVPLEAMLVATRIQNLISGNNGKKNVVFDKTINEYRRVEYRDIVILLRATASQMPLYVEEFKKKDIPVYADTGTGYFDTIEIKTIMSILNIIDNPLQDIPLLAVLTSPIFAFSPEELADIKMVNKSEYFYTALKEVALREEHYLNKKSKDFLEQLNTWRNKAIHLSVDELIWEIYSETGYYAYVAMMPGGEQRQANLRMLFQRGSEYEKTSLKGLFNFINFINKLRKSSGDMGSAKILGENENVVRIMSIHKSKGLEFPVVILAGTGKKFNVMDLNKEILFHKELGLGPDFVELDKRIKYPSMFKIALQQKIKIENISEEMRILYVALTRAKEKLIITGSVAESKSFAEKCVSCGADINYAVSKGNCYLDWICTALLKHKAGEAIYKEAGTIPTDSLEDPSKWNICFFKKGDLLEKESFNEEIHIKTKEDILQGITRGKFGKEIKRRLEWEYLYKESCKIPAKISVTEAKRIANMDDTEEVIRTLVKPKFLEETKALSGAQRGTIIHLVMEHLDFSIIQSIESIGNQIESMVNLEFLTKEQAKSVDVTSILRFFESKLGKRLLASKNIYKEVPFLMEVSSSSIYKELPDNIYGQEKIIIQGIIDCFFEEDGDIILIDYKTDKFKIEEIEEIKRKYQVQLQYYSRAIEGLMGKKVSAKYLYLFSKDISLELE